MNQMYDYNAGLLCVGKGTKEFKNGKKALEAGAYTRGCQGE